MWISAESVFLFYAIHLRQVFEKMGFSAPTRAKTEENNGFRTPLPYVFAAKRTVGQLSAVYINYLDHLAKRYLF